MEPKSRFHFVAFSRDGFSSGGKKAISLLRNLHRHVRPPGDIAFSADREDRPDPPVNALVLFAEPLVWRLCCLFLQRRRHSRRHWEQTPTYSSSNGSSDRPAASSQTVTCLLPLFSSIERAVVYPDGPGTLTEFAGSERNRLMVRTISGNDRRTTFGRFMRS